jgi:6-phosphogluconolactonase (cycloisomerase 2 family)
MNMGGEARLPLLRAASVLVGLSVCFLAGCGDFWQAPSGSSSSTTTTGPSSGYFYVLNQTTKQIAAYSIVSGTLTAVSGSPYALSATPTAIAISPSGNFLYVGTAAGIFLYNVGASGALTLGNNDVAISSDFATTMQIDSTAGWLVEAGPNFAELLAIPINSSTGVPTSTKEQTVQIPAATVYQLAIAQNNSDVVLALGASGTVEVPFTAGNSNPFGTVTDIKVFNSAGAAVSVAVDPQNRLFYVGETAATSGTNSGGLRAFNLTTLAEVSGSPYATTGLAPYAIQPDVKGDYVYVANRTVSGSSNGNIAGFAVTTVGTTYSLTALTATVSTGVNPVSLAEDSEDNYLLVVDSGGNPDLEAYTMSAGALTSAVSSTTGSDPVGAAIIAAAP